MESWTLREALRDHGCQERTQSPNIQGGLLRYVPLAPWFFLQPLHPVLRSPCARLRDTSHFYTEMMTRKVCTWLLASLWGSPQTPSHYCFVDNAPLLPSSQRSEMRMLRAGRAHFTTTRAHRTQTSHCLMMTGECPKDLLRSQRKGKQTSVFKAKISSVAQENKSGVISQHREQLTF